MVKKWIPALAAVAVIILGVSLLRNPGWVEGGTVRQIGEDGGDVGYGGLEGEALNPSGWPRGTATGTYMFLSDYVKQRVEQAGGSPVPVLVPYHLTQDEAAAKAHDFRLKISADGYTAIMRDGDIEIVINGTREVFSRGEDEPGARVPDPDREAWTLDYVMDYEDFDDGRGGSISFGFAACDYQVEFYCKAPMAPGDVNCVSAEVAREFVGLLVAD